MSTIAIPAELQAALHRCVAPYGEPLTQVDTDIWVCDKPVAMHTDGTADGLVTFGAILLNEPEHLLIYRGRAWDIPVGTLYRLDGREMHGTVLYRKHIGRFAFLAWDMPADWPMAEFEREVTDRLRLPFPQWGSIAA